MNLLAPLLAGEVPTAPVLMAIALAVAFVGSVGIGFYVVRHTPDGFRSAPDVEEVDQAPPGHAA